MGFVSDSDADHRLEVLRVLSIGPQNWCQKGQKVPDRSPFSPAPEPANDRSWHGNEAQASVATPGKSFVESSPTFSTFRSWSPQFAA